ncbi:MAG: AAA family ATPase [Acidimicrobiaceae bacterium]|nr:AAA family ATPase [Acidimicrobiaceae bacterium]
MAEIETLAANATGQPRDFAPLHLSSVHIRNFRGITECRIKLEADLTVLVGPNNIGKSRVIRALALALGAASANRDDFTVGQELEPTIDVVLSPSPSSGGNVASGQPGLDAQEAKRDRSTEPQHSNDETFDERLVARLQTAIAVISSDPDRERFAWRTCIRPSLEGYGARIEHLQLTYDEGKGTWGVPTGFSATREQRSVVAADLVNTGRDLADEMRRQGSPIRRVLDDLDVSSTVRAQLEADLGSLSAKIVSESSALVAVQESLAALEESIDGVGTPSLQPLPVRLEEMSQSVSVELDAGAGPLPMRLHGAGARSLASLQVQGVLYDRRLGRDGVALAPHPVSLIEEPEAHLHPQAQLELPGLLTRIRGQTIVTTHSAHLVSEADPRALRLLRREPDGIDAIDLHETDEQAPERARRPSLHLEEMEKLRRTVERPFGELVFASAVVLGDGATERALIPPLVRHCFRSRAQGLCVVDPGSMASGLAAAVLKFSNLVGLPWLLFADGDQAGRLAVESLVRDYGYGRTDCVVWVGDADDDARGEATEKMMMKSHPNVCLLACQQLGHDGSGDDRSLLKFMKDHKGAMGSLLAAELIRQHPWQTDSAQWPEPLRELIERLDTILTREPRADD